MHKVAATQHRRRAPSVAGVGNESPLLTVIVPVYNEVRTIDELLRRVLAAAYQKQVVVVDDGSTDGITEVLEKWEGRPHIELLQHSKNRGKAAVFGMLSTWLSI